MDTGSHQRADVDTAIYSWKRPLLTRPVRVNPGPAAGGPLSPSPSLAARAGDRTPSPPQTNKQRTRTHVVCVTHATRLARQVYVAFAVPFSLSFDTTAKGWWVVWNVRQLRPHPAAALPWLNGASDCERRNTIIIPQPSCCCNRMCVRAGDCRHCIFRRHDPELPHPLRRSLLQGPSALGTPATPHGHSRNSEPRRSVLGPLR